MAKVSISIDVPSLERAKSFYCSALDCSVIKDSTKGMCILDAGNVQIYLLEKHEASNPIADHPTPRTYQRHWTPVHLDFGVTDTELATEKVISCGGTCEGHDKGDWGSISYCADPFGNGFCLIRE